MRTDTVYHTLISSHRHSSTIHTAPHICLPCTVPWNIIIVIIIIVIIIVIMITIIIIILILIIIMV